MTRHLVILDIDGTLLDTVWAHQASFEDALSLFPLGDFDTNWSTYPEHLDLPILEEIFRRSLSRTCTPDELTRFDAALDEGFAQRWNPRDDRMLPNAEEFLERLRDEESVTVAMATGALRTVTMAKLAALDHRVPDDLIATSSEYSTRLDLVQGALHRAQESTSGKFDLVTSVGDGVWDTRAAVAAGFRFAGLAGNPALEAETSEDRIFRTLEEVLVDVRLASNAGAQGSAIST